MTKFIHATGHRDPIDNSNGRRFEVVIRPFLTKTPELCDICHRTRTKGNHQKCSKLRQALTRRAS